MLSLCGFGGVVIRLFEVLSGLRFRLSAITWMILDAVAGATGSLAGSRPPGASVLTGNASREGLGRGCGASPSRNRVLLVRLPN